MAVQLAQNAYKTGGLIGRAKSKGPQISVIQDTRQRHIASQRGDMNRAYIEAEARARANFLGLEYIDLYGFPVDTNHLIMIPISKAKQFKMGVFVLKNKDIYIATPAPGYDGQQQIIDQYKKEHYNPVIFLCSELSFEKLLEKYNNVFETVEVDDGVSLDKSMMEGDKINLSDIEDILSQVSTSQMVEKILAAALQNNASDIHFEPEKETYNLRMRLDGVLQTLAKLPKDTQKHVESRIKLMSGLKLNVDNVPQDGRFSFIAGSKEVDMRVSMLPSNYGYSIVMRLLGTGSVSLNLDSLGFTGLAQKRVMRAVNKPQGMILTTGPTGSGKTTTLYTFLTHLNTGNNKIITLEDPIEYKLTGISQTQIEAEEGYTFGGGLRSILRQDPDVVMVGEIRDAEVAEVAIQASLTGHQVLSTIHTNDAAGAIPRLMEMGVKGFLLADSLSAVIGQRLVRKICPDCKTEDYLDDEQKRIVIKELQSIPSNSGLELPHNLVFTTSKGCQKCGGLGYKGRIGVYEVLSVTPGLREILSNQFPSTVEVRKMASNEGMITMLQDGILKALNGVTDIKEVLRNVS